MPVTRPLELDDAPALADLLARNRDHLAPWQPLRPERYFTVDGQREAVGKALEQQRAGHGFPLVVTDESDAVVGSVTLASIIRGAFQSCSIGYWLAGPAQGRGLATRAVSEAVDLAFGELRLHRVQAETLVRNHRSMRLLERLGFERYGTAAAYMHIAGEWQDHVLFQLLSPEPERVHPS